MSAPLKIPETDFYACDDTENLTHTDPNEAIADFLDRYQTPGCDVLAECPETVTRSGSPLNEAAWRWHQASAARHCSTIRSTLTAGARS